MLGVSEFDPFALREHMTDGSENPQPAPTSTVIESTGSSDGSYKTDFFATLGVIGATVLLLVVLYFVTKFKDPMPGSKTQQAYNTLLGGINAFPLLAFLLGPLVDAFTGRFAWTALSIAMLIGTTAANFILKGFTMLLSLVPWVHSYVSFEGGLGASAMGARELSPNLAFKNMMPWDLTAKQGTCSLPGLPFFSNLRGISAYSTMMTMAPVYLILSSTQASDKIPFGSIALFVMGAIGSMVRLGTNCENMSEIVSGCFAGMGMGAAAYLVVKQFFPSYLPFLPSVWTTPGGGPVSQNGLLGGSLDGAGGPSGSQCQQSTNQEFVCHAYRNGELIA